MMPTVTITKNQTEFMATAGNLRGSGQSIGEALDSLVRQGEVTMPIIIHQFGGDEFFTQEQIDRKHKLRERRETLSAEEQAEYQALLEAELDATQERLKASLPR